MGKLGHVLDTSGPPDDPPRSYFVPHFGEDTDIKSAKKNIADAEAKFGHVLDTSGPPDPPPRNYFVPHFGTDDDIKSSLKNLGTRRRFMVLGTCHQMITSSEIQ